MEYLISIDTGSSATKISMFDVYGKMISFVRIPTKVITAEKNTSQREYEPSIWWHSTVKGIRELLEKTRIPSKLISAIGLTGQIGTHILLDDNGQPMMPAISWQDGRALEEADYLQTLISNSELDNIIGMHLPPGTAWPIPRLLWLKNHKQELFNKHFILLQTKDYIGYKLCNVLHTDVLSLRGLVHPHKQQIDNKIIYEILGIEDLADRLPSYGSPTSLLGKTTKSASISTGLLEGTPVITGCGDFHASLIGTGIVDGSYGFNITGTSDHIGRMTAYGDKVAYDERLGKYPSIIPGWDIWYGATSAGGGSVQWFLDNFVGSIQEKSIAEFTSRMITMASNSSDIIFLPYINGERAPLWDATAKGVFFGFASGHGIPHFFRSVLEGVAFSLNDCLQIMNEHVPKKLAIRVSGTAAGDASWNQIKADILGVPVINTTCYESTGLGAAIIAAVGIGLYDKIEDAIFNMVSIQSIFEPEEEKHNNYLMLFKIYKDLYIKLKSSFRELAEIRGRK